MPWPSIRFVRAAWAWFAGAMVLGLWLALAKLGLVPPLGLAWRAAHLHALLVGWLMQWVFGIAFWIYPAYAAEREAAGTVRAMAVIFWTLNAGTALRVLAEPWVDLGLAGPAARVAFGLGAAGQAAAGVAFVWAIRGRIRPARWIRDGHARVAPAPDRPENPTDPPTGTGS